MGNKKDSLGDRMKKYYENRTKTFLPRRTYTVIRLDGKAFHTYTRGLKRPFDVSFVEDMDNTAKYLCENIQGVKMAFVQSDEISLVLTDFDKLTTDAWYDGNIQKITSVSASLATAKFNQLRTIRFAKTRSKGSYESLSIDEINSNKLAMFDSRVFTIPCKAEVANYLIWRQQDTVRNSISAVAQSLYSHSELEHINTKQMQEMCFKKGVNWNNFSTSLKNGRVIKLTSDENERTNWKSFGAPTFQVGCLYLDIIPEMP